MTKGKWIAGGVVVAVLAALGGGYAYSSANNATTVSTATAATEQLTLTVNASGTVVPDRTIDVFAPIAGRIVSLNVADAEAIAQGAMIAKLDDAPLRLAIQRAEADLAAARAMPTSNSKLKNARNQAIQAAWLGLSQAQKDLAKVTIKSPANGTVTLAPGIAKGAFVPQGGLLLSLVNQGALRFAAEVDEVDIAEVRVGQKATVSLDAFAGTPLTGEVQQILPNSVKTDTGGNAYVVRIGVTPGDHHLRQGMSGSADIQLGAPLTALVVPITAISTESGSKYVYVVGADKKLVRTEVVLGKVTDTVAQITSGLDAGATVVTGNLTGLTNGMSVRVQ